MRLDTAIKIKCILNTHKKISKIYIPLKNMKKFPFEIPIKSNI